MKVVVACGGTGGHAFPGLAIAEALAARGHEVTIWDSGRAIESPVLARWTGPRFSTYAKTLSLRHAFALVRSLWRCRREMKRQKPDVLVAMGSYSSLPPVLAAKSCGVRIVLHEANTVPGKAIDYLSKFADVVAISFAATARYLPHARTVLTGLPVRREIAEGTRFGFIPSNAFVLFVTGGSQGAHAVNELASEAVVEMKARLDERAKAGEDVRPLYIIHQTGAADEGRVLARYLNAGIPSRVHAFEREMASAFASADFVIARAGASTCFELAACAKAVLFIPLPSAMRDHQHFNAEAFASLGAADEGVQSKLDAHALAQYLLSRYDHPERIRAMAEKIGKLATRDAAVRVAEIVEEKK